MKFTRTSNWVRSALLIASLLVCFSVAVSASETDWRIFMRASTTEYTNAGGLLQIGSRSDATDDYDPLIDGVHVAGTSTQAAVASYEPTYAPGYNYLSRNLKTQVMYPGWRTWTVRLWVGPNYSQDTVRLSLWHISELAPPEWVSTGYPVTYYLSVIRDPTGTFMPGAGWYYDPIFTGTSTNPNRILDFANVQGNSQMWNPSTGIELQAVTYILPEPASILTLATGLAAFGGYAWRRKRR